MQGRSAAVRLADVAERAGVSLATASFAMSGRSGVSEKVAERIRGIAAELGYVPNLQARALASGASSTVGLIVHNIADPYFSEIAAATVRSANRLGLMVQICQSSRDPEHELRQLRVLVASRVRAIVIAGSGQSVRSSQAAFYAELKRFQATGGRVAVIGRHHVGVDAVLPENEAGGRSMGAHFVALGHRKIAIASGPRTLTVMEDRLRGVFDALTAAGITTKDVPVIEAPFDREGGRLAAEQVLAEHPEVTGIIALNDATATGILATLRAHGISVPSDMSVSGFDDVDVAADLGPGLTTIHLPLADMGEAALALALKEPAARPRRKVMKHSLVVRGSTAPARGKHRDGVRRSG